MWVECTVRESVRVCVCVCFPFKTSSPCLYCLYPPSRLSTHFSVSLLGPGQVIRSRLLSSKSLDQMLHAPPEAQLVQWIVTPAWVNRTLHQKNAIRRVVLNVKKGTFVFLSLTDLLLIRVVFELEPVPAGFGNRGQRHSMHSISTQRASAPSQWLVSNHPFPNRLSFSLQTSWAHLSFHIASPLMSDLNVHRVECPHQSSPAPQPPFSLSHHNAHGSTLLGLHFGSSDRCSS